MLQKHSIVRALIRKYGGPAVVAAAALLLVGPGAWAASKKKTTSSPEVPVLFQAAIPVPVDAANTTGGLFSFDISWVDQTTQTYYLADRSNKAVDVVDAKADVFVTQFSATPAFAGAAAGGAELSGPNGVLTANGCVIATDAGDRVVSFTATGVQVSSLTISAVPGRADELAFDPKDNLLLVITPVPNGVNNVPPAPSPFGALISVSATGCVLTLGTIIPFPFATNGAEQPVWDPATQRFFVSIPNTSATDPTLGTLLRINPLTAKIEAMYSVTSCSPAGLALNPNNHTLLLGCSVVFDDMIPPNTWTGTDPNTAAPVQQIFGTDGLIQAVVPGVGSSDEVWYNAGDDHFYTGSSGSPLAPSVVVTSGTPPTPVTAVEQGAAVLGVIDGTSQRLDQLVPTFNVPAVPPTAGPPPGHPAGSAHSVAANENNNQVFVPLAGNNAFPGCLTGCVAIYMRSDIDLTGAND